MLSLNFICILLTLHRISAAEPISICFYTNWAQYRQGVAKFLPEDIDVNLCSYISYAFAKINLQTHKIEEYEWNDDEMIARVNGLKQKKPSLKTIISVGGWNHEFQPRFSKMVANATTRKIFIDSVIAFLIQHEFDGVSIDWEYPGSRGSPAGDKEKYTLLLKEMMEALELHAATSNTTRFILTACVAAGSKVIKAAYEINQIAKYLDWVNLMTYDLHGSWENITGCTTAMEGPIPTVQNSLSIWLDGGMPADKITLGLAAYGRSFLLKSASDYGLGAPANGPGQAGKYTQAAGSLAFYEICSTNWSHETTWIVSQAAAPYASLQRQWVGYDTVSSIRQKVTTLITDDHLKGFSFWSLDNDDFTGTLCNAGIYPLLTEAVHSLTQGSRIPVVYAQTVPEGKIHFHSSNSDIECRASSRWRHIKSLATWCRDRCRKQSGCPTFMCTCI